MWVKRFWRRWWCWFLSLILTQSNIFYTIWYGNICTLNREHELLGHNNYCNSRREEVIHKLFSSFFGEFSPKHHISSSFSSKIKPQKWHTLMNTWERNEVWVFFVLEDVLSHGNMKSQLWGSWSDAQWELCLGPNLTFVTDVTNWRGRRTDEGPGVVFHVSSS